MMNKVIYVDTINLSSFLLLIKGKILVKKKSQSGRINVFSLKELSTSVFQKLLIKILDFCGYKVTEELFYLGHMVTSRGNSVWSESLDKLEDTLLSTSRDIINTVPAFNSLNNLWGRDIVKLFIMKRLWTSLEITGTRLVINALIVDCKVHKHRNAEIIYLANIPSFIKTSYIQDIVKGASVVGYHSKSKLLLFPMLILYVIGVFSYVVSRMFLLNLYRMLVPRKMTSNDSKPSILLFSEDNLSLDKSYRSQPHWLHSKFNNQKFNTIILSESNHLYDDDERLLNNKGIFKLYNQDLYSLRPDMNIFKSVTKSIFTLLISSIQNAHVFNAVGKNFSHLFLKTLLLSGLSQGFNVKLVMTDGSNMMAADSSSLLARYQNMKNLTFQFSVVKKRYLFLTSVVDTMFIFSDYFKEVFSRSDGFYTPTQFISIGYIYDSSFGYIKKRAETFRKMQFSKGIKYIVCYLDENIQVDLKYGFHGKVDSEKKMLSFVRFLLDNDDVALLVKPQFSRNLYTNLFPESLELKKVIDNGQLIEFNSGNHIDFQRNKVFPAEVALCSDLVIGQSIGITASLESYLCGTRTVMLSDNRNDDLTSMLNKGVVYNSLEEVFHCIAEFRGGELEFFGDWSHFIDIDKYFDPYRDGKSSDRMFDFISNALNDSISNSESGE